MLEFLDNIDTDVFLFLNGKNNGFWDFIMYWSSYKFTWIPLYAFLLYLIIRNFRKETIWILIAIVVLTVISDQLSVLFKNTFERLRPCNEPDLQGLVHVVKDHCGGKFGFVSSHASNHFSLAVFLAIIFHNRIKYFTIPILLWAAFISYSRIYLGVHYPGDVICGAILGTCTGFLIGKSYFLIRQRFIVA